MKKELTPIARKLRQDGNPHEVRLWSRIRNRQLDGVKFHRQFPIGIYIVDFCCREKNLVVEVDGGGHDEPSQRAKDERRDTYLRSNGFTVVRVWASDVHANIEGVLERIHSSLQAL